MTNREKIREAVASQDPHQVAHILDVLRHRWGFRHEDCRAAFSRCAGVSTEEFEDLCMAAEEADSTA